MVSAKFLPELIPLPRLEVTQNSDWGKLSAQQSATENNTSVYMSLQAAVRFKSYALACAKNRQWPTLKSGIFVPVLLPS